MSQGQYADLFRGHPVLDGPDFASRLRELIQDPLLRKTFDMDGESTGV